LHALVVARQVAADRLPALTLIEALEQDVAGAIERVR
jgi:hypothetical protein